MLFGLVSRGRIMSRIRIQHGPGDRYEAHADRTAVAVLEQTGISPEIVIGSKGEYSVWLDDRRLVDRGRVALPSGDKIVRTLMRALGHGDY